MKVCEEEMRLIEEFAERDKMFGVAWRGALSQIRHKIYLESQGYDVVENNSGNAGEPDFLINKVWRVEHKRASSPKKNWANGDFRAELHRSRISLSEPKKSRLYDFSWTDVFAVDISRHTGILNDYRYKKAIDLEPHPDFPEKIYQHVRIDATWKKTLKEIIGVDDES